MVALASVLTIAAAFAATQVAANPANAIHKLLARQTPPTFDPSMIPQQCRDQCTSLVSSMSNNCSDLSCICGTTVANNMISCLQCGATAIGASSAESYYNQYADACKSGGQNVPAFSVSSSGGSSSSTGSSSSNPRPTGSSTSTSGSTGSSNSGSSGSTGSSNNSNNNNNGGQQGNGASRVQLAVAAVVGAATSALMLFA